MPNNNQSIRINLSAENIGPHCADNKLTFNENVDSLKAIFYATNGTGKSFISRTFRLLASEKKHLTADDLLTIGQSTGALRFGINDNTQNSPVSKQLSIQLSRGNTPTITDNTDYLFHVFNSEYVDVNIKPRDYTPNGDIEGYILGKVFIDLTEDRRKAQVLVDELDAKEKAIDKVVENAQHELRDNGIRPNQSEYAFISKDQLRNPANITCDKSFEEIIVQLNKLEKLPDNIPDIALLSLHADTAVFDEILVILETEYPKSEWDDEFVTQLKSKRGFINDGILLFNEDEGFCPFCGQQLSDGALTLISKYKSFLGDKEAHILSQLDDLIRRVSANASAIRAIATNINSAIADLGKLKKFFPSFDDIELKQIDATNDALVFFDAIIQFLKSKSDNIRATSFHADEAIVICKGLIESAKKIVDENMEYIQYVNTQKNNSSSERLALRRSLCIAQFLRIQSQLKNQFSAILEEKAALESLNKEITEKEEQARISKKLKVFQTLEFFLNRFFAGKYTIDESTFQIKFQDMIQSNASRVLSDGEKSIVAFCFYLASTHLLINREDDYNRLFFIIDDPVSSMDFHFVYAVAQVLRDVGNYFSISEHVRMFVFTHNLEFYSIIIRNYIISQAYVIKQGVIQKLKKQLLMPYESHLHDVLSVASGASLPTHTISNSVRHIIETVCHFEFPDKGLKTYISENEVLHENSCIFSLCQDMSHGALRAQPPFDEQVLTDACKTVIRFMNSKYKGQIDALNA